MYAAFRYTSQLLVQLVAGHPLTRPISKRPVTSKQFAELRLAAFEVLGHLHKVTTEMKGHDAAQVEIEEASTGGLTLRSISSASARSSSLCLSVSLLSIAMLWYSSSSRSIAC
jgi:hypothetical protein